MRLFVAVVVAFACCVQAAVSPSSTSIQQYGTIPVTNHAMTHGVMEKLNPLLDVHVPYLSTKEEELDDKFSDPSTKEEEFEIEAANLGLCLIVIALCSAQFRWLCHLMRIKLQRPSRTTSSWFLFVSVLSVFFHVTSAMDSTRSQAVDTFATVVASVAAAAAVVAAAAATMTSDSKEHRRKKLRSYDKKKLRQLLGWSEDKVSKMMSQPSLLETIRMFFNYNVQTNHLESTIRSHGHGPHGDARNVARGIFWIIQAVIQAVDRFIRTTRVAFLHYPPPDTIDHVDSDGNGTCFTFRILAANVNRAIRMKFRDIFHSVFDLMPFCQDIGYNVSKDYYSNLGEEQKKEFVQGHVRVLVSFFLGQISIGQLDCRCFFSGAQGCLLWPRIVRDAAIAANIIAIYYGYDHYRVTCPMFDIVDNLVEFDLSSNAELPSLESISVCHPAAFCYRLSEKMGVRFDAALTYVLAEILKDVKKRLTLFTRRARYCEMAENDGHAVRAGYGNNEDERLWSKVGGEYINMPQSYRNAVTEGRSILGRMGYAAVIANIMEAHDCSEEEARTIFGQWGYEAVIANIMDECNCTYERAKSIFGRRGYDARIANIIDTFGCSRKEAKTFIAQIGYEARVRNIMDENEISYDEAKTFFAQTGAAESILSDERGIPGLHPSKRLKRDRKSMSERGLESAATDEGEKRGTHLKRNGVGAGVVKTPSMSARGSAKLGSQRTSEPFMLLEFVSSTVEPDAPPVSKITRNHAEIADVLLENQFFKSITTRSKKRIKECKEAAGKSVDNSHTFTTRKQSNNAPRASDVWKLSLHESVESVKAIAPNATKVNDADRAVSASYREGEAQRSKESRKQKP